LIAPHIPKIARYGLGAKIEQSFISTLEMIHQAIFAPTEKKSIFIEGAITRLDTLSFFLQIAWENKLIPEKKYLALAEKLNAVGKNLGGWKKFIKVRRSQIKTPK
jgi:hypothetical protein